MDGSFSNRAQAPSAPWPALPVRAALTIAEAVLRASRNPDGEVFDPGRLDRRDPALIAGVLPALDELNARWLRLRVEGIEHVRRRPALFVANHNGGIMGPDLFCTMATLWRALGPGAPLYAMAHDFAMRRVIPIGRFLQKIGGMRADPACASRALGGGGMVLAYPGGDLDAFRHFRDRNRIVFGARTGFVRVAQEAGVPIVPIVAHGAHRSAVIVHEGEALARALGLTRWSRIERFPIALALPWGIGAGPWVPYLPLPFPIRLRVLPPIEAPAGVDPRSIRDQVVGEMQRAMDGMVRDEA